MRKKSTSLPGSVLASGVWMGSAGRSGRTICGVTTMTRSVSFFWYAALRVSAAGQEARGIAGQGGEIGLRQVANQTFLLERIKLDVDRELPADQAADQEPERRRTRQQAGRHDRRDGRGGRRDVRTADTGA